MKTMLLRQWATLGLVVSVAVAGCGGGLRRFALRPPVTREVDRPLSRAPHASSDSQSPYFFDQTLFRPLSHTFTFEQSHEAHNVNALDEVPDSSWFTNRRPSPSEAAVGACADHAAPQPPYVVQSAKEGGATPGFVVRDALGHSYVFKFDQMPVVQPELSTAADAIGSRLYWSIGYNTPCNRIVNVRPEEFSIGEHGHITNEFGHHRPLALSYVTDHLRQGTVRPDGSVRMGASLFIEGQLLGPWTTEGTRGDDPNDVVPHENRRELRGERLLAAWVNHWDARAPNSIDAFQPVAGAGPGAGVVRHYQLDFGDLFGARPAALLRQPRMGYGTVFDPGTIITDTLALGAIHHPWEDDHPDPDVPMIRSTFDVEHFDPLTWTPSIRSTRFEYAHEEDLAWMARRIAYIGPEHLSALIGAGEFTNPRVAHREWEILMGRRDRILRWAFARRTPLNDLAMADPMRLCAVDLAVATGVATADATRYALEMRTGRAREVTPVAPMVTRDEHGSVCVAMPPHFAPAGAPDDAHERYATLDLWRLEGERRTRLRAHFYDLGPERGYTLVGVER